jgi:hypothetical protein
MLSIFRICLFLIACIQIISYNSLWNERSALYRSSLSHRRHHIAKYSYPRITWTLSSSQDDESPAKSKKGNNSPKDTKVSRIIDDFIGKRFGAGEAFYGKRTSSLTEEEYQSIRGSASSKLKEMESKPFRDNAILLVGDVHIGVAQWIVFDLHEKGFNIRLACTDKKQTITVYGLPGFNVDMIELSAMSPQEDFARALNGVQAIIFCGNFDPLFPPFLQSAYKVQELSIQVSQISILYYP